MRLPSWLHLTLPQRDLLALQPCETPNSGDFASRLPLSEFSFQMQHQRLIGKNEFNYFQDSKAVCGSLIFRAALMCQACKQTLRPEMETLRIPKPVRILLSKESQPPPALLRLESNSPIC